MLNHRTAVRDIVLLLVFLSCLGGCGWSQGSIPVELTLGREFASVISLPGGTRPPEVFREKEHRSRFSWNSHVEFRSPGNGTDQVFLRVFETSGETYFYDQNIFVIECSEQIRVRSATEAEWIASGPPKSPPDWITRLAPLRDGKAVPGLFFFAYEGKTFRAKGKHYAGFLVSPNRMRVAAISWNGEMAGPYFPSDFTYCIDIYDLATTKHLAAAQGEVHGVAMPAVLQEDPNWITDRYFTMPLSEHRDKILLFDFERTR